MRTRALHASTPNFSLRRAITDGELRLHCQPIVNLTTVLAHTGLGPGRLILEITESQRAVRADRRILP
jgi:EAL domain-containing protein (putative c-di-GMP-specific phosphodiesterase class I)